MRHCCLVYQRESFKPPTALLILPIKVSVCLSVSLLQFSLSLSLLCLSWSLFFCIKSLMQNSVFLLWISLCFAQRAHWLWLGHLGVVFLAVQNAALVVLPLCVSLFFCIIFLWVSLFCPESSWAISRPSWCCLFGCAKCCKSLCLCNTECGLISCVFTCMQSLSY